MIKNILNLILIILFSCSLYACGAVKEGFSAKKRSEQSDEFLVQKKNPLVQPPDFNKLPVPKSEKTEELETTGGDEVKKLLEDYSVDSEKISSDEDVKSIEESILEKIN